MSTIKIEAQSVGSDQLIVSYGNATSVLHITSACIPAYVTPHISSNYIYVTGCGNQTYTLVSSTSHAYTSSFYLGYKFGSQAASNGEITWGSVNSETLTVTTSTTGVYYIYYKYNASSNNCGNKGYTLVGLTTILKRSATCSSNYPDPSYIYYNPMDSQYITLRYSGNSGAVTFPSSVTYTRSEGGSGTWQCNSSTGRVTIPAGQRGGIYTITGTVTVAGSSDCTYSSGGVSLSWNLDIRKNNMDISCCGEDINGSADILERSVTVTYPSAASLWAESGFASAEIWRSAFQIPDPSYLEYMIHLNSNGQYSYEIIEAGDVGTVTNYFAFLPDDYDSWNDSNLLKITFTVNKYTPVVNLSNATYTYDGTNHHLNASVTGASGGATPKGKIHYSWSGASGDHYKTYNGSGFVALDDKELSCCGSVQITAWFEPDGTCSNVYNNSASVTATLTINPIQSTLAASLNKSTIYNTSGYNTAVITVSGVRGTITPSIVSGSDKVTISGYNTTNGTVTVTYKAAGSAKVRITDSFCGYSGGVYVDKTITCTADTISSYGSVSTPSVTQTNLFPASGIQSLSTSNIGNYFSPSASQTVTYTSGYTRAGTITYSWRGTSTTIPSLGCTGTSSTTSRAIDFTVIATGENGAVADKGVQSGNQQINSLTWGNVSLTVSSPVTPYVMAASGETKAISASALQSGTYTSGCTTSTIPTISYEIKTEKTGYSLDVSTGKVTVTNNKSTSARNGFVVTVKATGEGNKVSTSDRQFNQSAGDIVYETPTVTFTYSDTGAAGTTNKTPSMSYSQVWTWNGVSGSGETITSGCTVGYTTSGTLPSGFSKGTNFATGGAISWENRETTSGAARNAKDNITLSIEFPDQTRTYNPTSCKQNANALVSISLSSNATLSSDTYYLTYNSQKTVTVKATYTSGSEKDITDDLTANASSGDRIVSGDTTIISFV